VDYYKDYVEVYGIPKGIGKADYKNRIESYRIEKQRGKVIRISHVNCKGKITEHHDSEHTELPNDMQIFYTNDGKVDYVKYLDRNGKTLHKRDYDENLKTITFKYDDEFGTEMTLAKSTTTLFENPFDNAEERGRVSKYRLTFDENGYLIKVQYANSYKEVCDNEGIYGRRYVRDSKGRKIEEHYLGFDDKPKANKAGLAIKKFEYDNNDDWTKVSYFAANGELSDDGNGCPVVVLDNDKYGNRIKETYYDGNDSLSLRKDVKAAAFSYIVENGLRVKQTYLGIDGKQCYVSDGYAAVQWEYDENGYESKLIFLDMEDNPTLATYGFAQRTHKNDTKGNDLEEQFLDIDNNLLEINKGYAKSISEYDSLGNRISVLHYDSTDSLCTTTDGFAGTRYVYNDRNLLIQLTNFGMDNKPVENSWGATVTKLEYNNQGNEIKRAFYTTGGQTLVLIDNGIAGWKSEYEDSGNKIKTVYFDEKGNPTAGNLGYAQVEYIYDKENGFLLEIKNLDKAGQLVFVRSDGYAGKKYKRDARGNITEELPYGTNGRLVAGEYIERKKYDDRDNVIERTYFDANGNKTLQNGYHKLVSKYDERNQETEASVYGINGEFVNTPQGYATMKVKYDNRGNIMEYATYNTLQQLVSGTYGYAVRKIEYDAMNREIREAYLDANGQPTNPSTQIPELKYGYDKWGNKNYYALADGKGNLINHPKYGYAYYRSEFDIRGSKLSQSYYDKNDKPYNSEGYYKNTYTYDKNGNLLESRYYNSDDSLRKESYAIIKDKYNEQGQLIERTYFNYLDKAFDFNNIAHKFVYSYDEHGNRLYLKRYKANGSLEATLKWNEQTGWEFVQNNSYNTSTTASTSNGSWRERWKIIEQQCPLTISDEVEISSASIQANGCLLTIRFLEISKYNISDSELQEKKSEALGLTDYLKSEAGMPGSTTLTLICVDKAKRELFRLTH
jgi:serine/threonine-protein kinase